MCAENSESFNGKTRSLLALSATCKLIHQITKPVIETFDFWYFYINVVFLYLFIFYLFIHRLPTNATMQVYRPSCVSFRKFSSPGRIKDHPHKGKII